jgi:hypothetical protein
MIDYHEFALDSLFCEWAYVIDLDREVFEVYEGFSHEKPTTGRWADAAEPTRGGYWPVRLIQSWPLQGLPDDSAMLAPED